MTYVPGTEVATFPQGSQFEGGESAYLCVFFGCADIAACSPPGRPVSTSWEWVDQKADTLANEVQGNQASVISRGASLEDEYSALQKLSLSYSSIPTNSAPGDRGTQSSIRYEIDRGRPVLLCAAEASFIDKATGKVDYHWSPTGNHCIVVSGYDADNDLIVHDYAAVGNGWVPGSSRTYLASRVEAVSATAVTPYWLKGSVMSGVPTGWSDDGNTLKAPNGNVMVLGFRQKVLDSNWDPADMPNEHEYNANPVLIHAPSFGAGDRQTTRDKMLWWTSSKGVVVEPYLGLELSAAYALIEKLQSEPASVTTVPPVVTKLVSDLLQAASGMNASLSSPQTASTGGEPVVSALVQFLESVGVSAKSFESSTSLTPPPPPAP